MRRLLRWVSLAAATWALPAAAQELELRAPSLSARPCPPQQRATCGGGEPRVLPSTLQCDACDRRANVTAAKLQCALGEMPLGPHVRGCPQLPLETLPPL